MFSLGSIEANAVPFDQGWGSHYFCSEEAALEEIRKPFFVRSWTRMSEAQTGAGPDPASALASKCNSVAAARSHEGEPSIGEDHYNRLAWAIALTGIGLATITRPTKSESTGTTAMALPVASTTTTSSVAAA